MAHVKKARSKQARHLEPSDVQIFLQKSYPTVMAKIKTYFVKTEPESSAGVVTGDAHILYFEPFLQHWILIGGYVHVYPKEWAAAFIQQNLDSTVEHLCKAILTIRENLTEIQWIPLIISKAAVWMMSKFSPDSHIDPWAFPATAEAMANLPSPLEPVAYQINAIVTKRVEALRKEEYFTENIDNFAHTFVHRHGRLDWVEDLDAVFESLKEEENRIYKEVFEAFAHNLGKMEGITANSAQISAALLRATISRNTDFIVDAVQLSHQRWKRAFQETEIAKIAGVLSKTIFRLDFQGEGKNFPIAPTVENLCKVKLLAIYRAAKFIQQEQLNGYITLRDFNSKIAEHNLFPTREECRRIDVELTLTGHEIAGRCRQLALLEEQFQCVNIVADSSKIINCDSDNFVGSKVNDISQFNVKNEVTIPRHNVAEASPVVIHNDVTMAQGPCTINGNEGRFLLTNWQILDHKEVHLTVCFGEIMCMRTHVFPTEIWDLTCQTYLVKDIITAGKVLVPLIFNDDDEVLVCAIRPRKNSKGNGFKQFPQKKLDKITDALHYIVENVEKAGKTHLWTSDLEELINRKVVTEKTSQIRKKIKLKRALQTNRRTP